MKDSQFRILYRQFLFRMVDLELLSADAKGDMDKLFGQFAALLIFISLCLCILAGVGGAGLVLEWSGVHFMIAVTMLVVGLFAILSWDSTFPDKRDVMVLAPLPIRSRTVFFAKIAAVGTALGLTVAALHCASGFVWPMSLNNYHAATIAPSIAYDSAMEPLSASGVGPVLGKDLAKALQQGRGAVVGVWKNGEQRVFAYGAAKPDSIFEIGSITKTFTGLALAQMVEAGKARLDEPVRELLPPDTVRHPDAPDMTLLDLATHRSGLPPVPNNLHPGNMRDAYAGYSADDLYAFLRYWGAGKSPYVTFQYSNLGFGLLGHALANRAGVGYEDLVNRITGPLGMPDTVVTLSDAQEKRLIQGYSGLDAPVGTMDLGVLAGAGAIKSTAGDMLRYLAANLHQEKTELRAAIEDTHKLRGQIGPGADIALAWAYDADHGIYEHDGGTAGYTSDALFSPQGQYAVVVLTNAGPDMFQFASVLAEHVRGRLAGERAISLNTVLVPAGGGGGWGFLREFAAWWGTMLAAGAFIYCCVLGAQGLAAQLLPRKYFLRLSSYMQMAAFGIFVGAFFLEPKLVSPGALLIRQNSAYLEWSPSYWFLGLFQQLNGSPALPELATRAWIGMAVAFGATGSAYTLAYLRTMRKIVEEPDIAPAVGGRSWLPGFGNGFATAVGQFSIRTILRSRQHRLLLALYLGLGFATAILFRRSDQAAGVIGEAVQLGPLCATIMIMIVCLAGIRVVFSMPTDMRANWIFRIMPLPDGSRCMVARRRAFYALSVAPVCLLSAPLLISLWGWRVAAQHLLLMALLGSALAEVGLHGRQKLPFTCSYLPGKSNFNISFLLCSLLVFTVMIEAVKLERDSFGNAGWYGAAAGLMLALAIAARWSAARLAASPEGVLQFEEAAEPAIFTLDLHRDGVTPISEGD